MSVYLGIDPGMSGAAAYVKISHNNGEEIRTFNAEAFEKYTPHEWYEFLLFAKGIAEGGAIHAMIERVGPMPLEGVSSVFKFGYQAGQIEAYVSAADIPYEFVTPQEWQKTMKCLSPPKKKLTKTAKKNINKRAAQALFPGPLKITHATADALLIAEYCRRIHGASA